MATLYFENFLNEYNSNSKEKADGYTLSNFDKMDSHEKSMAYSMLSKEFNKSSVAADALIHLNKNNAYELIKKKYESNKNQGHINYHLAAKLWKHDKNSKYVEDFISCFEKISDIELISYLNDAAEITLEAPIKLFTTVINTTQKLHIRRHAAIQLLNRFDIDKFKKELIFSDLKSESSSIRKKAIEYTVSQKKSLEFYKNSKYEF